MREEEDYPAEETNQKLRGIGWGTDLRRRRRRKWKRIHRLLMRIGRGREGGHLIN
jgi:hypothetical protein